MTELGRVHRSLLEARRGVMNLVGPGPIAPHFEDIARGLAGLQPVGRWVDLGSGAGFPGLVLADLFPSLEVDLVDSRRKRVVFLEAVVAEAGVGHRVRARVARTEDLPAGSWDGATARAFAPPPDALAQALRLVRPGGQVVLFLGPEVAPPHHPEATVFHVEHYAVEGRPRQVVAWRRHGSGTETPPGA